MRFHVLEQRREFRIERRSRRSQLSLALDRHCPRRQQLRQRIRRFAEDTLQSQLVLVQQFPDRRLNQRCRKPRLSGVTRPRMRSYRTADWAKYETSAGPPTIKDVPSRKS